MSLCLLLRACVCDVHNRKKKQKDRKRKLWGNEDEYLYEKSRLSKFGSFPCQGKIEYGAQ